VDGRLALARGELVAVLVRLEDEEHGADRGRWFPEAGFGRLQGTSPPAFHDLDAARAWLERGLRA
jgi:hypothetical protein